MFKFLGRVLGGLLLTQRARAAVHAAHEGSLVRGAAPAAGSLRGQAAGPTAPELAALPLEATEARSAKRRILAKMSDEEGAKRVGDAIRRLINEDRG